MPILVEERGPIAIVTINRPEAMNALDAATNLELTVFWDGFEADRGLRVAIITGAGEKAFSAGADLKTLLGAPTDEPPDHSSPEWNLGGITRRAPITKPIIAAINGHCLAGGLEVALCCDIRLCSPNATFGLSEVRWAVIPGAGGTQRLPQTVPLSWAMEIILTGDSIKADQAERIGLVNRIVPQADLMTEAIRIAETISRRGPLAVRAAKEAVVKGLEDGFEAGMARELDLFAALLRTEDAAEGPAAFAEKREPRFQGL